MIDGRGQPRITDFGLAGLAAEIPLSDLRSGTPAYMSPEQRAGREVTTRSDLYSLGLVLHEMFTGKSRRNSSSNPGEIVKELDPAIERVILRCLEEEPKRRPSSALAVAMALPGADPIAAALAAGETPSPEMVAASGEKEGFSARSAVLCFIGIVAALLLGLTFESRKHVLGSVPVDIPPDALAYRAQEILRQLGYTDPAVTSTYGFDVPTADSIASFDSNKPADQKARLADDRPMIIRFWYRQHTRELFGDPMNGRISYGSPPNIEPGMIRVALDTKGRLMALDARPEATGSSAKSSLSTSPPNWL